MARRPEAAQALKKRFDDTRVTPSSGNVFADLGLPDAEEALLKSRLAQRIAALIEKLRLTQSKAAALLGVDQPKVSKLLCGRLSEFSTERLLRFLTTLDQDIDIVIKTKPRSRRYARLSVVAA
jgi:predicted XRE-type DNA-binding protein